MITDTAIINMVRNSLNNPLGALAPYRSANTGPSDIQGMYRLLCDFWNAVKETFLKHGANHQPRVVLCTPAGIQAMGVLMDRIYGRHAGTTNEAKAVRADLERIAPDCSWTKGVWEGINLSWNEVQNTNRHIKQLADTLVRLHGTKGIR